MNGLVIGKFMPPHLGHLHLFDFAAELCDDLSIVVERIAGEPIDSTVRAGWVAELAPRARVLHLDRHMPQQPGDRADFWAHWRRTLTELLPHPIDLVFASEAYGARLAQELGARFVPVDPQRSAVDVSATRVRADPASVWPMLPPPVRAHYTRRIAVVGPWSAEKTHLSRRLARQLGGLWVPDHARILLDHAVRPEADWPATLRHIAHGQRAQEAALARQSPGLLVCDTDLLTTRIWWERQVGDPPAWLCALSDGAHYDLTVLCRPGPPRPPDGDPSVTQACFDRFEAELQRMGRQTVVVSATQGLAPVIEAWRRCFSR
mgnify:CR=1 FL=1